jgi:flagellar capping protein FliD
MDDVLTDYNSSTGLLRRKLLPGGEFARESELIESRLESTNDLLEAQTRTLWLKFNAMESALSRLQTQSNYLSQQLASLSG